MGECEYEAYLEAADRLAGDQPPKRAHILLGRATSPRADAGALRFVMCLRGQRTALVRDHRGEREVTTRAGHALIIGRNTTAHAEYRRAVATRCVGLVVADDEIRLMDVRCRPGDEAVPVRRGRPVFVQAFRMASVPSTMRSGLASLESCGGEESEAYRIRLLQNVFEDAARLLRQPRDEAASVSASFLIAREFVEEHYHHPITRDDVAATVRLHPNHISRLFQQQLGRGFASYLADLRLRRAADLLTRTNLSVKEVAAAVGFGHASNFYRRFVDRFGVAPSDYRRQHREA